jgi:hypothetical protein
MIIKLEELEGYYVLIVILLLPWQMIPFEYLIVLKNILINMLVKIRPQDTRCIDCKFVDLSVITNANDYYCKVMHVIQPRLIAGKEIVCAGFKAKVRDWDS